MDKYQYHQLMAYLCVANYQQPHHLFLYYQIETIPLHRENEIHKVFVNQFVVLSVVISVNNEQCYRE